MWDLDFLIHTIDVQRATQVDDSMGGVTETWATVIDDQSARVDIENGSDPVFSDQDGFIILYRIFVEPIDILETDRIIYDGQTHEIINIDKLSDESTLHHLEIITRIYKNVD